jgi:hypothetical protein
MIYYVNILTSFGKLSQRFVNWDPSLIDSPLSEIVKARSDMDRILELAALYDRMKAKVEGASPAAPSLASPLKMLKFLTSLRRDQMRFVAELKKELMQR